MYVVLYKLKARGNNWDDNEISNDDDNLNEDNNENDNEIDCEKDNDMIWILTMTMILIDNNND